MSSNISAPIRKRRSGTTMVRINSSDSLNITPPPNAPLDINERRRSTITSDLFDGADFFDSISSESKLSFNSKAPLQSENAIDDDFSQFEKYLILKKPNVQSKDAVKKQPTQQKPNPQSDSTAKVASAQSTLPSSSQKEVKPKQTSFAVGNPIDSSVISSSEAKLQLDTLIKQANTNYLSYTDQFTSSIEVLRGLSNKLKTIHDRNIKFARNFMKYEIALDLLIKESNEREIERIRTNIDNFAKFHLFISQKDPSAMINFAAFVKNHIKSQEGQKGFIKKTTLLKAKIRSLPQRTLPNNPNDIFAHYMDQSTETGRIMNRFKVKVRELRYADLEVIADAISEKEKAPASDVINILFDCAWYFRTYPICDPFKCSRIPKTDTIIPKVFDPPFLEDEWVYMTFDELSSSDWPLKPAVDELFEMMILTNPFDIAKKFYSIINIIGKCVQRIFIWQNKESKFIDIDFDQLFVLMLLCIFTSGLSEIVAPMMYSYSFREYIMDDYQIQYAMSHMEGLCQHIKNIDWNEIRRKSLELQENHAKTLPEPLFKK